MLVYTKIHFGRPVKETDQKYMGQIVMLFVSLYLVLACSDIK